MKARDARGQSLAPAPASFPIITIIRRHNEVLGVASGFAQVMLGGPDGRAVHLAAGDAVLLPAGTGHCQLSATDNFLVVGAYPRGQDFDVCREVPTPEMLLRIEALGAPANDPLSADS